MWPDGVPIAYNAGQLVQDKDPILKTHGHLFQDVESVARPQPGRTEAAVNEPGALRTLTPPTGPTGSGQGDVDPDESEGFDPVPHTSKEVLAHLGTVGEAEVLRVLAAEAKGENRSGISKVSAKVLEDARARDAAAAAGTGSE